MKYHLYKSYPNFNKNDYWTSAPNITAAAFNFSRLILLKLNYNMNNQYKYKNELLKTKNEIINYIETEEQYNQSKNKLNEYIKQIDAQKYRVYSKKGKNLGTYNSKKSAEKRLKQIHYFKSLKENNLLLEFPHIGNIDLFLEKLPISLIDKQNLAKSYLTTGIIGISKSNHIYLFKDNELTTLQQDIKTIPHLPSTWEDNILNSIIKEENISLTNLINEILTNIPKILYHATYQPLLKSIKLHGLDSTKGNTWWEDSDINKIYLATDIDQAASFAESSEDIPEEYEDKIIIISIDTSKLNKSKLSNDINNNDINNPTFEYSGTIPTTAFIKIKKYE